MNSGTININESDTAQTVVNRAIRKLYKSSEVKLYCRNDYKRLIDITHHVECKLRRMNCDVVWKFKKYRNAMDVTICEATGFFHKNGQINANPFSEVCG